MPIILKEIAAWMTHPPASRCPFRFAVETWDTLDIALQQLENFRKVKRGRASANTMYHKVVQWVPSISCSRDENAISKSEVMDGIFPSSRARHLLLSKDGELVETYHRPAERDPKTDPRPSFNIPECLCVTSHSGTAGNLPSQAAECRVEIE